MRSCWAKPEQEPVDISRLLSATGAREHRIFPGKLDSSRLGFAEKAVALALRAPEGDFRDWRAAREWGWEVAAVLKGQATPLV